MNPRLPPTTFHVLGLAHQCTTQLVTSCAYTAKIVNMCRMLLKAGHNAILYHAGSVAIELPKLTGVQVVDDATMENLYGSKFYETYNQNIDLNDRAWKEFRRNASKEIGRRLTDQTDIVLATYGAAHQAACPSENAALTVESGIGYEGVFARCKVWESYAWQHFVAGQRRNQIWMDRDTVIPNYIDPKQFTYEEKKEDHALFLGRVIPGKGVLDAYEACKLAGKKLVIAGPGDEKWIKETMPEALYVGMVGIPGRRQMLAKASVLFALTKYTEPFGGVAVEAAYSGTPVIASDWGAFTETVIPGKTGFRVRDVFQAATVLKQLDQIQPAECRSWASQFEMDRIWPKYDSYFEHQLNLFKRDNG